MEKLEIKLRKRKINERNDWIFKISKMVKRPIYQMQRLLERWPTELIKQSYLETKSEKEPAKRWWIFKKKTLLTILIPLIVAVSALVSGRPEIFRAGTDASAEVQRRIVKAVSPGERFPASAGEMRVVTGYSPKEGCDDPECVMASGKRAYEGATACPRKWKLGTRVRIESEVFICEDRLAKKYDDRIDIFMESYEQAKKFGKQELMIYEIEI